MRQSIETLLDLLTRVQFQVGLVLGVVALAALWIIPRTLAWARPWAIVTSAAVLVGIQIVDGRRLGLVAGVVLMAAGGWFFERAGRSARGGALNILLCCAATATGALLIPWRGQVDDGGWFYGATPVVAVCLSVAMSTWTTSAARRCVGPVVVITAFAVWTTVPDTEFARLLLGVTLPLALGTMPPVSANLTVPGCFALAGVLAWLPTLGGEARPASIVGAWASVGVLVLVPIARVIWAEREMNDLALLAVHAAVALVAARVIGLWTWAVPAVLAAIVLYAVALATIHWLGGRFPRAQRHLEW